MMNQDWQRIHVVACRGLTGPRATRRDRRVRQLILKQLLNVEACET